MSAAAVSNRSADLKAATVALVLLTGLNLVNYIDRYVLAGVQELVKGEFHVSDERLGSLATYFFLTYIVAAPLTGWLGDHYPRKPLIVAGALFWSGVNLATALVHSFDSLLWRHAALGIGEASFGIFGPAVLADFYPPEGRNRALTIFNVAIPVGAAIGYAAGGWLGQVHGWRSAFYVSAVPGLLLAIAILFLMKEPARGATDGGAEAAARTDEAKPAEKPAKFANYAHLAKNPAFVWATLGYAMSTFCVGGISNWMPTFLQRVAGETPTHAGFMMGAITAATGLLGTAVGGIWAQRWLKRDHRALYFVAGLAPAMCIPFAMVCFFGSKPLILPALGLALFTIFLGSGPVNAAIVNSVPGAVRATALAAQLFLIHFLGDVPSPRVIGLVSDHSNLRWGLGVTLLALVLSAVFQFVGSRYAPRVSSMDAVAAH